MIGTILTIALLGYYVNRCVAGSRDNAACKI
jgi:hypothetical protein